LTGVEFVQPLLEQPTPRGALVLIIRHGDVEDVLRLGEQGLRLPKFA
jgi:hypothetical protein